MSLEVEILRHHKRTLTIANDLFELSKVSTCIPSRKHTLFGSDLNKKSLQIGELIIVRKLTHTEFPEGGIHVTHANDALSITSSAKTDTDDTSSRLSWSSTAK